MASSKKKAVSKKAAAKKAVSKKTVAKKTAPKRSEAPTETIRGVAEKAIKDGATNAQVLKLVQEKFPDAKTTEGSIRWYRSKMKEAVPKTPGSRDAARAQSADSSKDIFS